MAYSQNFPAQRPSFMFDAANSGRIPPNMTFTRSDTPPTYAAPSAVHYWSNEKHESSQNLILQSQNLDTTWTAFPGTPAVTGGQTAPDGTSTGWLITAQTASSAISQAQQSVSSVGASTTYTLSAYLKAGTASHTYMTLRGSGSVYGFVEIDWADPLNPRVATRTFASASATVTAVGSGGWYRVALTTTTDASTSSGVVYIGPSDGTTQNANGYPVWNSSGETALAWGVQLEQRGSATTYNATTTQIHREYAPTLKSVATAGQPRFEYSTDGQSAGTSLGILIESQATNLVTYSDDLTVSFWTSNKTNQDNISDVAVGPTGALADMLKPTTATGNHYSQSGNVTTAASSTYTFSAYVKSVNGYRFRLQAVDISPYAQFAAATFTLTGAGSADVGAGSATIAQLSDGWYRVSVTGTAATTTTGLMLRCADSTGALSFAGDGYSGIICTGVQFESGSHASSYIKSNSGSTTTRAAESLSMDLTALGIGNEVTAVGEAISTAVTSNRETVIHLSPSGSNDVALYAGRYTGGGVSSQFYSGGGDVYLSGGSVTAGSAYKFAAREAPANHALCLNGGTVATNTSAVDSTNIGTLHIGSRSDGSNNINGHVKRVALYNEALSDTNLQALTS